MGAADYAFAHTMTVPAPPEEVHAVLVDLEFFGEWWPQVRAVASLGPDDALVVCRSVLPYDLELHLHALDRSPRRLEVAIAGPISGTARWELTPVPGGTRLDFEQRVRAEDRLFVLASHVLKPLLAWNHERMMRGAEEGLRGLFSPASRRG